MLLSPPTPISTPAATTAPPGLVGLSDAATTSPVVAYFCDPDVGRFHYAPSHPMKPHRVRMTHSLILNYGLFRHMLVYRPKPATREEMVRFHTDDYVDFLTRVTPETMDKYALKAQKYNVGDDCPVFDGLFDYCSLSAGGSLEAAARLNLGKCDIAINWAGGLHHAKKSEASGFCYINDIVLAILELLRYHKRVLYIDIDVHHGDGVEEAFYTTDRVMTLSFHKYGEFFPGTGGIEDTGAARGKHYALNFPLRDGASDATFGSVFEPVVAAAVARYAPTAIVLQCGADSLAGDRIGVFNLSLYGHARCISFVKGLGLPLMLLGGGGYTVKNVARAWAYETSVAAGIHVPLDLPPDNEYYGYFAPDYSINVPALDIPDANTPEYLSRVTERVMEHLRRMPHAPSVAQQAAPPSFAASRLNEDTEDVDGSPEVRVSDAQRDTMRVHRNEMADDTVDGEAAGDATAQTITLAPQRGRRRRIYERLAAD